MRCGTTMHWLRIFAALGILVAIAGACGKGSPSTGSAQNGSEDEDTAAASKPAAGEEPKVLANPTMPDPQSREGKALAFFEALKSGDATRVEPLLLSPDDCSFMKEEMEKDGADPNECRDGVSRFRSEIGNWLPPFSERAASLRPTGKVRFEKIPEPSAPTWAFMVTIETAELEDFPIAAFHLGGTYRFGIPMKRSAN